LHAILANLIPGGLSGRLSHAAAVRRLATIEVCDGVIAERKQQAADLLSDVGRLDLELSAIKARITVAVKAANTSLTRAIAAIPTTIAAPRIAENMGMPVSDYSRSSTKSKGVMIPTPVSVLPASNST